MVVSRVFYSRQYILFVFQDDRSTDSDLFFAPSFLERNKNDQLYYEGEEVIMILIRLYQILYNHYYYYYHYF